MGIQVNLPLIFIGLLIGGAVPFLVSAFLIRAVGRSAFEVVEEVRRQFREIPGIMEGTAKPEYYRCVDIATVAAQRELLSPAVIAISAPIAVGMGLGAAPLGGFLAGAILTGQLMAVFQANTGGAWDNAKKKIEDGFLGGKGTEYHKAGVIGDTVGDPMKDTAGPALNPLIKVMNLVSLLIAPVTIAPIPMGVRVAVVDRHGGGDGVGGRDQPPQHVPARGHRGGRQHDAAGGRRRMIRCRGRVQCRAGGR